MSARAWATGSYAAQWLEPATHSSTLSRQSCDRAPLWTVGEREACRTGLYCFHLAHAEGHASFCCYSSKELVLWLQALQAGGIKYEDPPLDLKGISSLFELSATLLSGEPVELSRYKGCVCLVVNVASK